MSANRHRCCHKMEVLRVKSGHGENGDEADVAINTTIVCYASVMTKLIASLNWQPTATSPPALNGVLPAT